MLLVNAVAEIVHSQVDKYGGSVNKNIGEAFLLVWKFRDPQDFLDNKPVSDENRIISDMALFGFLKIIAKINKFQHIMAYRKEERLLERMPNFTINMGFGLHQGWAIEGAIGSLFKIDASYLSPNVNMTARLEAATRQFGVPILISGKMYETFSDDIKAICREIDKVTVKGSVFPERLFTV